MLLPGQPSAGDYKATKAALSCSFTYILKIQALHFDLSLQARQIRAGSKMDGKRLTIRLTVVGILVPITQAKRLTEMEVMSENCGVS